MVFESSFTCGHAVQTQPVSNACYLSASQPAAQLGLTLSPWWLRRWVGLLRTPFPTSLLLAVPQAIRLVMLTLAPSQSSYSGDWP